MSAGYPPINGRVGQCCPFHRCNHSTGGGGVGVQDGGIVNQVAPSDIVSLRLAIENLNKTFEIVIETFGPLKHSGMVGNCGIKSPVQRVQQES